MVKLQLLKVHEDKRGAIFSLVGDLQDLEEIAVMTCKKGFARGGCIHLFHDEFCIVFEGIIFYHVGKEGPKIVKKGEVLKIPKKTPHYFVALQDSIVAEWGASKIEKMEKHQETRKIVDKINKKMWEKNDKC